MIVIFVFFTVIGRRWCSWKDNGKEGEYFRGPARVFDTEENFWMV